MLSSGVWQCSSSCVDHFKQIRHENLTFAFSIDCMEHICVNWLLTAQFLIPLRSSEQKSMGFDRLFAPFSPVIQHGAQWESPFLWIKRLISLCAWMVDSLYRRKCPLPESTIFFLCNSNFYQYCVGKYTSRNLNISLHSIWSHSSRLLIRFMCSPSVHCFNFLQLMFGVSNMASMEQLAVCPKAI